VNPSSFKDNSQVPPHPVTSSANDNCPENHALDFSVIIPIRDRLDSLESLLHSIRECRTETVSYEIIVADDGSAVDAGPLCERYDAILCRSEIPSGPADARNRGAQIASGNTLLFLDSDVIYTDGLMEKAREELDRDPGLHAVSFINQSYDSADSAVANYVAVIERYWLTAYFDDDSDISLMQGFCSRAGAVRKQSFDAVGGFDVSFRTNAMEDYDFGRRLAARFRVALVREPIVYHSFPTSLWRIMRNYFARTALFIPYYVKHKPAFAKAQTTPSEAMLRLAGALGLLFVVMAISGIPTNAIWVVGAVACIGAYLLGIARFLLAARRWSNSAVFSLKAFVLHYSTTLAIVGGAVYGLFLTMTQWIGSRSRGTQCRAGRD